MLFIQPGVNKKCGIFNLKSTFNYYATDSLQRLAYANIVNGDGTNTQGVNADFKYDYDRWGFSREPGINLQEDIYTREVMLLLLAIILKILTRQMKHRVFVWYKMWR